MKDDYISEIKSGNLAAFYTVFHEYNEKLYQYIYNCTRSTYYAEEVTSRLFSSRLSAAFIN